MNPGFKVLTPLFITFFVLAILIFTAKIFYAGGGVDYMVVMAANCLFFLISLFVFRMQYKAMHNSNPNIFIRSVMAGMIIKVFACIIAVVAYYFLSREAFNKPAVYISMVIYIIFLTVEVRIIMKLNKSKNA
jgi:hypothetical protein